MPNPSTAMLRPSNSLPAACLAILELLATFRNEASTSRGCAMLRRSGRLRMRVYRRRRLHLFQPPRADLDGSIVRQSIYDRFLDMGETILNEVCNPNNVSLPHNLLHGGDMKQPCIVVPDRLQGRAVEDHVPFVTKSMHVTLLTEALFPGQTVPPAHDMRQTMTAHTKPQQGTQSTSTNRLQKQGNRPAQ